MDIQSAEKGAIAMEVFDKENAREQSNVVEKVPGNMVNAVSQEMKYNPGVQELGTLTPDLIRSPVKSGQTVHGKGAYIYNAPRSSPDVEAKKGELKYHTKITPESPTSMRLEMVQLRSDNKDLTEKVNLMLAAMAANIPAPPPAPVEAKSSTEIISKYAFVKYQDLQKLGKKRGINVKGMTKETIIKALESSD